MQRDENFGRMKNKTIQKPEFFPTFVHKLEMVIQDLTLSQKLEDDSDCNVINLLIGHSKRQNL